VSFALHWIRAEIHEYVLKNWRLVKVATTKSQRKLFFNLRSLKQSLNALTLQEADAVARELNVSRKDVLEMETRLSGTISIDPMVDDGEEGYSLLAYLASPDENPRNCWSASSPNAAIRSGRRARRPRRASRHIKARHDRGRAATCTNSPHNMGYPLSAFVVGRACNACAQ
jgi:DNA-directed RNA polymerase sigma subunit (sigma70/sigma32)